MADILQRASSGRSKCRGCARPIAKGELRFCESYPNPYAEGEAQHFFHLACAASMRPEKFRVALDAATESVPERDWLERTARIGEAHRRVPRIARAERASSGRARCRQCHELIEKGVFRIGLQLFEEGRMSPSGYVHVSCVEPYFGTRDILDRIARLTPDLQALDLEEIERLLDAAAPGIAKTHGVIASDDARAKA